MDSWGGVQLLLVPFQKVNDEAPTTGTPHLSCTSSVVWSLSGSSVHEQIKDQLALQEFLFSSCLYCSLQELMHDWRTAQAVNCLISWWYFKMIGIAGANFLFSCSWMLEMWIFTGLKIRLCFTCQRCFASSIFSCTAHGYFFIKNTSGQMNLNQSTFLFWKFIPSSSLTAYPLQPIPADIGRMVGYTLDTLPVYQRGET